MNRPDHERWRDELRDFEEAAIEAELETGRREESIEQAKRHLLLRVARVTAGVVVLPGPGFVVLAAGLALLAQDVPFARRLLERVRKRLPEGEDGQVSKLFIVVCSAGGVFFMGVSVWWTFFR